MLSKELKRVATQVNRRSLRKVKATISEIYVHDQILAGNILGSSEDEGDANASAENLAGLVEEAWREYLEETYPDADINIDIEVRKNVSGASRPLNVEFGDSYDFDTDWEKTRDLEHVLWEISQSVWEKRWDDWFVEIRSARSARSARRDPEFEKFKELAEEYGIIGAVYPNDLEKNFKLLQDSEIEVEYKGQIGDVLLRAYWEDPTVNDGGCMSIPNPDAKAFRLSHKARKVKADTEELTVQTSWGELNGTFEQNSHGWFAIEVNGLKWPYDVGTQPAASSPEEAAENLLAHYGDEPILAQDYYDEVIAYEKKQSRSARRSTQTRSDRVVKRAAKWTVNKIVEQAKVAGFTVEEDGGAIQIYKVHKGHGKIILGVERWPNGTWTRMDIDPSVSTAIRKLSDVASILGL